MFPAIFQGEQLIVIFPVYESKRLFRGLQKRSFHALRVLIKRIGGFLLSRNEQQGATKKKSWPKNCPWPEPTDCGLGYDEDFTPDKGENLSEHVNLL